MNTKTNKKAEVRGSRPPGIRQIAVLVDENFYRQVKIFAAAQGTTITELVKNGITREMQGASR